MKFIGGMQNVAKILKTKQRSWLYFAAFAQVSLYHLSCSCGLASYLKPPQIRPNPRMHILVNYNAAGLR